jgi:hypothetical protein
MNAVNWLKRRVSLSSPSTSPIQSTTQPRTQPNRHSRNNNVNISTLQPQHHPTNDLSASISRRSTINIGARNMNTNHHSGSTLMHGIIDPSSPLSILAATSKLTTFPYGELQALSARMNIETTKINGVTINGDSAHPELNGVASAKGNQRIESGDLAPVQKPLSRHKLRSKERLNSTTVEPAGKILLSSTMAPPPVHSENLAPASFPFSGMPPPPPSFPLQNIAKQRNVTASSLPKRRTLPSSHKKSVALSSTQNTRRSKRLKTSHPALPIVSQTLPLKPLATSRRTKQPQTPSITAPSSKKRVLPVRQGHIDILDGEISLLSTPQRLDSNILLLI